jgi:hypothetical protein
MATAAVPGARRFRRPRWLDDAAVVAARWLSPAKPAWKNLASVPLFVAGLGCADFAAFHLAHGWGWLATGVSLIVLENAIADEQ